MIQMLSESQTKKLNLNGVSVGSSDVSNEHVSVSKDRHLIKEAESHSAQRKREKAAAYLMLSF